MLRKLSGVIFVGVVFFVSTVFLSSFAHAQQFDLAASAGSLFSTANTTASAAFLPAAERGGIYAGGSVDVILKNRFGFLAEVTARNKKGIYNNYQEYRPVLYDVNGMYAPEIGARTTLQLMAGVGAQTLLFGNVASVCPYPAGCAVHVNGTQFLTHLGVGARYTVWRQLFVRPEAHYYRIINNSAFHSDNVFRLGVSVGYTFGE